MSTLTLPFTQRVKAFFGLLQKIVKNTVDLLNNNIEVEDEIE